MYGPRDDALHQNTFICFIHSSIPSWQEGNGLPHHVIHMAGRLLDVWLTMPILHCMVILCLVHLSDMRKSLSKFPASSMLQAELHASTAQVGRRTKRCSYAEAKRYRRPWYAKINSIGIQAHAAVFTLAVQPALPLATTFA